MPKWYVTVEARYQIEAATSVEAEKKARDMVSSRAWDRVTVRGIEAGEPYVPYVPKGIGRWAKSFEAQDLHDVWLHCVSFARADGSVWWTNGIVALRAETDLEVERLESDAKGKQVESAFSKAKGAVPVQISDDVTVERQDVDLRVRRTTIDALGRAGKVGIQERVYRVVQDTVPAALWLMSEDREALFAFDGEECVALAVPWLGVPSREVAS